MVLGLPDTPLVNVAVVVVATGIVWLGSGWLEESADRLAGHYGLPPVVQGSVVVAVGSSLPELASVVASALRGAFGLGVGAVVGSAIFNVLVIPGVAGLVASGLETNREIVYKEAQFYMIAVAALVVTFALAVIYAPVGDPASLAGEITRPLALLPLALYGLYLFVQVQDVGDYEGDATAVSDVGRQWATLVAGLAAILVAVEALVGSVESLAATAGVPEFLAGVTILAAATSLPDALVSVRAAQNGAGGGLTSLANVLGSNIFDLLVVIPLGVLLVGSVTVEFAVAAPMMGVLTVATVVLFAVTRTDLSLTRPESVLLLAVYAVFFAWIVAETLGATDVLRTAG